MKTKSYVIILAALVNLFSLLTAYGTMLIFESTNGYFGPIPQDYGDNVTETSTGQKGYVYGPQGGPTPHVFVEYRGELVGYPTGYGDLTNVIYLRSVSNDIRFAVSDPRAEVALHSFEMGGWPNTDQTLDLLQVLSETDAVLFARSNITIRGTGHSSFIFSPPLRSKSLTIRMVGSNAFGVVGIDNVLFSQFSESELLLNIQCIPGVLVYGTVGRSYRVDYSDGLSSTNLWNPLATLMLTNNPQLYVDADGFGRLKRFYRAIELP